MRAARARAACRVDLGGGTLDIWPLGLLAEASCTVNVAVGVWAEAEVEPRTSGWRIEVEQGAWEAGDLEELTGPGEIRLPARTARALSLPPATIRLTSGSPRGAGLGASSAIAVALVGAIETACEQEARGIQERAALIRDIEAQMMGRPTGIQDQFPPQLGGVLAIDHRLGAVAVRRLRADLDAMADRLTVAYSGQSHISADTNWHVVRACLDGEPGVLGHLRGIASAAAKMPRAIEAGDWPALGFLVREEWEQRRRLTKGIATPEIEGLLARAISDGAWGGKVCGAGGGGCVAVLAPPEAGDRIRAGLEAGGAEILAARPTDAGLAATVL